MTASIRVRLIKDQCGRCKEPKKCTHEVVDDGGKVLELTCRAHGMAALGDAQDIEDAKGRPPLPEEEAKTEAPKE